MFIRHMYAGEGLAMSSMVMLTGEWSDHVVGRMVDADIFCKVHWSRKKKLKRE